MNLDEMEEVLAAKQARDEANKALAQRWLGNHNLGTASKEDRTLGWSYPCRNNCHSHCQSSPMQCKCPCHDNEWCGAGTC